MSNNINNSSMLKVGTILHGVYRIDGYLSSGGFGNTYVATNIELGDRRAIKECFMSGISQRDGNNTTVSVFNAESEAIFLSQREKFKKEARCLRELQSDHIVKVYDLFEENGTAYYVMDYIDGENLSERLKRTGKPMSENEVMEILLQILDALDAAHKAHFFHLNIEPSNIIIDTKDIAELIDFGADWLLLQKYEDENCDTSMFYGNDYTAPELCNSLIDNIGPWTDFYSLGATLFNLLTNKRPHLHDVMVGGIRFIDSILNGISPKLKWLIVWLMEPGRQQRPQSVEEIEAYLNNPDEQIKFYLEKVSSQEQGKSNLFIRLLNKIFGQ